MSWTSFLEDLPPGCYYVQEKEVIPGPESFTNTSPSKRSAILDRLVKSKISEYNVLVKETNGVSAAQLKGKLQNLERIISQAYDIYNPVKVEMAQDEYDVLGEQLISGLMVPSKTDYYPEDELSQEDLELLKDLEAMLCDGFGEYFEEGNGETFLESWLAENKESAGVQSGEITFAVDEDAGRLEGASNFKEEVLQGGIADMERKTNVDGGSSSSEGNREGEVDTSQGLSGEKGNMKLGEALNLKEKRPQEKEESSLEGEDKGNSEKLTTSTQKEHEEIVVSDEEKSFAPPLPIEVIDLVISEDEAGSGPPPSKKRMQEEVHAKKMRRRKKGLAPTRRSARLAGKG